MLTGTTPFRVWIVGGPVETINTVDAFAAGTEYHDAHGEWPDFIEPAEITRGDPAPRASVFARTGRAIVDMIKLLIG